MHSFHIVSQNVMAQLVTSCILVRLDYCNWVLVNLPTSTITPLQRVQNIAAHLVFGLDRRFFITSTLCELHWLSVHYRILFKLASNAWSWCLSPSLSGMPSEPCYFHSAGSDHLLPGLLSQSGRDQSLENVIFPSWNSLPPKLWLIDLALILNCNYSWWQHGGGEVFSALCVELSVILFWAFFIRWSYCYTVGSAIGIILSSDCLVCLWCCAFWLSGLVYRAISCTSVILAGMFLFVPPDTFAVGCII